MGLEGSKFQFDRKVGDNVALAVDKLYYADSRHFNTKFLIYFDPQSPTEVTDDNHVIDWHLFEGVWDNSTILGGPVTNTLDLTLSNPEGIFTPKNTSGPYYGKISTGVKIQGFLKVTVDTESSDWEPLGTFYVYDWKAPSGTATAEIYAKDKMAGLLAAKKVTMDVVEGEAYTTFIQQYLTLLGYDSQISGVAATVLPFGWVTDEVSTALKNLLNADLLVANYRRKEVLQIESLLSNRGLRDTLTDTSGCIISADDGNSLIRSYSGVGVYYYAPVLTPNETLLSMTELSLAKGTNNLGPYSAQATPIYVVDSVMLQTVGKVARVKTFQYTSGEISLVAEANEACTSELTVKGTTVQFEETATFENTPADDTMLFQNPYIQTLKQAERMQKALQEFFDYTAPLVTVETIGNMSYQLLDHVIIDSKSTHVFFDGIIVQMETDYNGSLSQRLTLMHYNAYKAIKDIFFEIREGDLWLTYNTVE